MKKKSGLETSRSIFKAKGKNCKRVNTMKNIYGFNQISFSRKQSGKIFQITLLLFFVLAVGVFVYLMAPENSTEQQNNQKQSFLQNSDEYQSDIQKKSNVEEREEAKSTSFFARFGKNKNDVDINKPSITQKTVLIEQTDAQHEKWADDTYAELFSSVNGSTQNEGSPSIAGRVLNEHGQALGGVEIIAKKRDYFKQDSEAGNTKTNYKTVSSSNGVYAFKGLSDGIYLVSTNSNKRYLSKNIEVNSGVSNADLMLTELQTIDLKGKVLDSSGNAVEGVNITPVIKSAVSGITTNADGEFEFSVNIGSRSTIPLRLQKKDYQKTMIMVKVEDSENHQDLIITVPEARAIGRLFGKLQGRLNEDMSDYLVQLYSPSLNTNYRLKTDGSGSYNFENIELGNDYYLWVRPEINYKDFKSKELKIDVDPISQNIQLQSIDNLYQLSGQVLDMNKRPMTNATLAIRSVNTSNNIISLHTDEDGNYSVKNVPEGEIIIKSISQPLYSFRGIRMHGSNFNQHHDLIVDRGRVKLIGEVVDESGSPVPAPQVSLTSETFVNGVHSFSSRNTSANAEGKFIFTDLGARQYTLLVTVPGYKSVRKFHNINQQSPVIIRLKKEST